MKRILFCILSALCLLTLGCGGGAPASETGGYTMTDDFGTVLHMKEKPKAIYASTLGLNEILVDLVPPERILAVPESALDGKSSLIADKAAKVAARVPDKVSAETIVSMRPDLIILQSADDRSRALALKQTGIPVCELRTPVTYEEIKNHIEKMAEATGETKRGEELIQSMDAKINDVHRRVADIPENERKIVMAHSVRGVFGSADGIFHHICEMAGVRNGAAMAGLKKGEHLSNESIVVINPDYFIFPDISFVSTGGDLGAYTKSVLDNPAFHNVTAVKDHQFITMKDRYRYATSQYIADAVYDLASQIYPERFKDETEGKQK